ncbi:MAG: hypothetical protein ABEI27_03085, partial [Halobellus sp.]|uniref:hypothetical protein n=1 Tax=Halobellus sp. TaxID=1979212 RepID=UPI0035D50EA1
AELILHRPLSVVQFPEERPEVDTRRLRDVLLDHSARFQFEVRIRHRSTPPQGDEERDESAEDEDRAPVFQ